MDRPKAPTEWAQIRARWLEYAYAMRVQEQWPEIELGTVLETRGHRDLLVGAVAQTYGLDSVEAERAVSIWYASRTAPADEWDRSDPFALPNLA